MSQKKVDTITLIGCAVENLPVTFDLCYDVYGATVYHIYKNMEVDSTPELPEEEPAYTLHYYEPEDPFLKVKNLIIFGVTGPYAKRKVFDFFNKKCQLQQEDVDVLVHPKAIIAPSVNWRSAALIEPGVVISAQTRIGFAVTIKRSVSIGHHCSIGDFVEINPGVTVSGHVTIGKGAIIGAGAVLRNGITIGENSMIGMGSVVTKDIPDNVTAFGSPCKVVREKPGRE